MCTALYVAFYKALFVVYLALTQSIPINLNSYRHLINKIVVSKTKHILRLSIFLCLIVRLKLKFSHQIFPIA